MADGSPLVRQWTLLKMLGGARNGVTLAEMTAAARVNPKTIRRDLQAFTESGFPLEELSGPHGRKTWRLMVPGDPPELSFAFDEALALYLGRRFLEPLHGTFLWQAAQNAFEKIRACLGRNALKYLDRMVAHLHATQVGGGDYAGKAELIDDLLCAIEDRKVIHMEYQSLKATESVEYEIEPYAIALHKNSLYLIAFSRDHNEVRHFKVDRIEKLDVSKFPFRMPDDFDLSQHLSSSFGIYHATGNVRIKVKFLAPVARYVQENKWHPSQKLQKQKDGSVLTEFQLSSIDEIQKWLLSFGRNAIVLEPKELRDSMVEEAERLLANYYEKKANSSRRAPK